MKGETNDILEISGNSKVLEITQTTHHFSAHQPTRTQKRSTMVRNNKASVAKPKAEVKKWLAKPPTKAQLEKIIEESKEVAAQATKRAIEAIQNQGYAFDPRAQLPQNPQAIFDSPARTKTNSAYLYSSSSFL